MSTIIKTPSTPTQPTAGPPVVAKYSVSVIATTLLRFGLAFTFLWPFLDKTFGLGYSTIGAKSWLNGNSPTKGFLGGVSAGPFKSFFTSISGSTFFSWLFMLTLLGVGVALFLGVVLRFSAICGGFLLFMMWVAEWPMVDHFDAAGKITRSSNPFLDDHLMYIVALVVVASAASVPLLGLGKWWRAQTVVIAHPFMR